MLFVRRDKGKRKRSKCQSYFFRQIGLWTQQVNTVRFWLFWAISQSFPTNSLLCQVKEINGYDSTLVLNVRFDLNIK